jgi:hypothetical protein
MMDLDSSVSLSDFVLTHKTDTMHFADVTFSTFFGPFWNEKKHVSRRKIARLCHPSGKLGNWYYVDTGQWCHEPVAALERAWRAQEELKRQ